MPPARLSELLAQTCMERHRCQLRPSPPPSHTRHPPRPAAPSPCSARHWAGKTSGCSAQLCRLGYRPAAYAALRLPRPPAPRSGTARHPENDPLRRVCLASKHPSSENGAEDASATQAVVRGLLDAGSSTLSSASIDWICFPSRELLTTLADAHPLRPGFCGMSSPSPRPTLRGTTPPHGAPPPSQPLPQYTRRWSGTPWPPARDTLPENYAGTLQIAGSSDRVARHNAEVETPPSAVRPSPAHRGVILFA
ncbi:hypothetical protein DFH09DRAFT_478649 [Mycena vulgaris]|nr:hypothetical protein DFH09DRAFT_478649 [Mycena vulgaris]